MVWVDVDRCAFCGSCVSVCPVQALELQETRLLVGDACTECGVCLAACPMGAIVSQTRFELGTPRLQDSYDVIVVGAGPSGSAAAAEAAQRGLAVLLLEKDQEIGSPVRCAEGLTPGSLEGVLEPDPRWVCARIRRAEIHVVQDGQSRLWMPEGVPGGGEPSGVGYILERRIFDQVLAEKAAASGARVLTKAAAVGLIREGTEVRGVRINGLWGERDIAARVVIGADGVESRVGVWAGLDTSLPPRDLMVCAQFLMAGVEIDPECTYYFLDAQLAPGGYAWVFPKGERLANVGLGLQADLAAPAAVDLLTRFLEQHPFLACGSVVALVAGGVPVGLPPRPMVADGCMLVGDAARQVDPLTGGGIANGMAAGRLAAAVAADAVESRDVSQGALAAYEKQWWAGQGRRMARNYRLREKFPPEERDGQRFLSLFALSVGGSA